MDRKSVSLFKSSLRNIQVNIKTYIFFVFTITILIAIAYSLNALSDKQYIIANIPYLNIDNILLLNKIISILFFLISSVVIFYVDGYIFDRQKEKYFLLRVLGESRKSVSIRILVSEILLFLLCFLPGICLGTLFNYHITNHVIQTIELEWENHLRIYFGAVLFTFLETVLFLLILYIRNRKRFNVNKLSSLLVSEKKIELKKKSRDKLNLAFITLLIGSNLYLMIYYNQIKAYKDVADNVKNLILLLIISICFALVFLIMNLIMNFLQKQRTRQKSNLTNLVALVDITAYKSKVKWFLFISTVLLLLCGIIPITSNILIEWSSSFNTYKGNIDIQVSSIYNSVVDPKNVVRINEADVENYLSQEQIKIDEFVKIKRYLGDESTFLYRRRGEFLPYIISLTDYNKARKISGLESVVISDEEFLVHRLNLETQNFNEPELVLSNGEILKNSGITKVESVGGEVLFNNDNPYVIVVNDGSVDDLLFASESLFIRTQEKMPYDKAAEIEDGIIDYLNEKNKYLYDINNTGDEYYELFESKIATIEQNLLFMFQLALKLLSSYFYIIASVAALNILSFQYLNIQDLHRKNKKIHFSIGMNEQEYSDVRKKERHFIYYLPLVLSTVSVLVFILQYCLINIEEIRAYIGFSALLNQMIMDIGVIWILVLVYAFLMKIINKEAFYRKIQ